MMKMICHLKKRVAIANKIAKEHGVKDTLFISIHSDAMGMDDIRLKDITPSFVEGYQNWCMLSLKPSTCNKQMKMLKRVLAFAVEERYIDVSPFQLKLKET